MAFAVHDDETILQHPELRDIGPRLLDPCVALRARQCSLVCLKTDRKRRLALCHRTQRIAVIQIGGGQPGKLAADLVETRIQVNERLARDDAAEDFPRPGERGLCASIQRVEALPKFLKNAAPLVGGAHQIIPPNAEFRDTRRKCVCGVGSSRETCRRIEFHFSLQLAAGPPQFAVAIVVVNV